MKKLLLTFAAFLFALSANSTEQLPRPEYPRPQFERKEWLNLNGTWTYTFDFGRSGKEQGWAASKGFDNNILVPFCPESKLSGVEHTDFINAMWYQRYITVPETWSGKEILLHFQAVDYDAHIYINGKFVDRHVGTGSSFAVNITDFVECGKQASLVVQVDDNTRSKLQPCGKQVHEMYPNGCMYTRTTGIWQTVWMEPVDREALKNTFAIPDIDQKQLVIRPEFVHENDENTLTVSLYDGKKLVAEKNVPACNGSMVVLPVKNMKLWSPESPFLYDLIYTVKNAKGEVLDKVSSYAGMRKVHTKNGYFYLNNKPYFQRLVLDQGFYPEGVWTAPSDEALKQDIEMSIAVGFNGARLHQKAFEERYLYWADKLGYLTWGEQASWGIDENSDLAARNFISEWTELLVRDRNHPSIVTWTPFNETWGCANETYVRMMKDVYDVTKAIDPTRPINDASGDGHVKTDIWSVHDYEREESKLIENHTFTLEQGPHFRNQPEKKFLAEWAGQPYMIDEFGGLPWIAQEERANSWGYGSNIDTLDEFYRLLEGQIDAIIACPRVVGFCYTQITDVMQEKNGIYYYDRRPKFDNARLKAIFTKIPAYIELKK